MSNVLIDSSFLFALFHPGSRNNEAVVKAGTQIGRKSIVAPVVLTEVTFLFDRLGGVPAVTRFLTLFAASQPMLEPVTTADLIRARDIMNAYPEASLDFVDCCIVAVAERLQIDTIATLDRRDFSIIRPRHIAHFTLIP